MSMKIDFNKLYSKLDELKGKAKNENLDKCLDTTKPIIQNAMNNNVPIDTGELKSNLGEIDKKGTGQGRTLVMGVKREAKQIEKDKAYYNYYGTKHIVGTHWMEKAFNSCKGEANEQLKKSLKEVFKL